MKDFITKLLIKKPENRMSLTDALNHPWIKKYAQNWLIIHMFVVFHILRTQLLISYSLHIFLELLMLSFSLFVLLLLYNRLITFYGLFDCLLCLFSYSLKDMIIDLFAGRRSKKETATYIHYKVPSSKVRMTKCISVRADIKLSSRVSFLGAKAT